MDDWERAELDAIREEFPGWHVWPSVAPGRWYARRLRTSPPIVTRPVPVGKLRAAIVQAIDQRAAGREAGG